MMDKKRRDTLNWLKSELEHLTHPKMGKNYINAEKVNLIEKIIKSLS